VGRGRWQPFTRGLGFQLFLVLFGLLAVLLAIHTALVLREQRRQLMESVLLSADRVSEVVRRSTHAAMMRNQRAELHEMIQSIGAQRGFDGLRVYNKMGSIVFSTDPREIGRTVDQRAEACWRCHAAGDPLPSLEPHDRMRIFPAADGHRVLAVVAPIPNAPGCSAEACHAHAPEQKVLGVLDVRMSLASVDQQLAHSQRRMRLAALGLVFSVALGFAIAIHRLVHAPVGELMEGTRAVSAGRLDHRIEVQGHHELGTLASAFNAMTEDLRCAEAENRRWAATLEDKVRRKSDELEQAQAHLVRVDRMASLGKLAATVAHEINNPLAGILTYSRLLERDLATLAGQPEVRDDLQRYAHTIGMETRRCGDIVRNLLAFARTGGAQMAPAHLNELIAASLALIQHHLDLCGIRVERHGAEADDTVICAAGEIEQALLALLVNAAEAMPSGGTIVISTNLGPQVASISVTDTGCGIPPEILPHVFEPFFTTKSAAKGVGLGLAVVYGIMQRHGGSVDVQSKTDAGSCFTLAWPRHGPCPATFPAAESAHASGAATGGSA
jgi:two-component system NtrC family sensor kinase